MSDANLVLERPGPAVTVRPVKQSILSAHELCRQMDSTVAVSNLSLQLFKGDTLGLLGLNGAGKSTTLKMLCGMLVPDSGSVTINGFSMSEQPLLARAHIGFLPDQPPLYNHLRIVEYLRLCGQIRGMSKPSLQRRLNDVLEQCDLSDVRKKLIGTLSKGYRQRVGLAQAIIHEPAIVLLDEPSNGLDPQQLDSMRTLITDYAEEHAVVFSTHLLSEAQASCNRVAIMHEGQLVADKPASGADLESVFHRAIA